MTMKTPWTVHGYVGPTMSGKTYLALKESAPYDRQLRFNRNEDNDLLKTGAKVIRCPKELIAELKKAGYDKPFKICYEGHAEGRQSVKEATDFLVKCALRARNLKLILDESQDYMPNDISQETHYNDLFTKARQPNVAVSLSWTSFTPKTMKPTIRNNTASTAIFYCSDELFTEYLRRQGNGHLKALEAAMQEEKTQYSYIRTYNRKKAEFNLVEV